MFQKTEKKFYGRRKGRKISSSNSRIIEDHSYKFYIREEQISKFKLNQYDKNILFLIFLEITFFWDVIISFSKYSIRQSPFYGRAGETWTLKDFIPEDFESPASTSSATAPFFLKIQNLINKLF